MASVFPGSIKTFVAKTDLVDTVLADHVNTLQEEVNAVEATIGLGSLSTSGWAGTYSNPTTFSTITLRIANIEAGLTSLGASKLGATANAVSASKWATARTLSLAGDVTGSVSVDGTANASITADVVDDSHAHTSATLTGFATNVQDTVGAMVSGNTESGIAVTYDSTGKKLNFDVADPTITLAGDATGAVTLTNLGNATLTVAVAKWANARTLTLTGSVNGSATIDGSANVSITTTSAVTDSKAPIDSAVLTGTPTSTTAPAGDSSLRIATTAFVTTADTAHAATTTSVHGIADTSALVTLTGSQTMTNKTVTGGTVNPTTLQQGGIQAVTVSGSQTLTNKTIQSPRESMSIVAASATGTINIDLATAASWYYTSVATGAITLNLRASSSVSLDTLMAVGDAMTVIFLNTNGTTPYFVSVLKIDSTTITPKWQFGTPATVGNASGIDSYVYDIVKTAAATFTVFASLTKYA